MSECDVNVEDVRVFSSHLTLTKIENDFWSIIGLGHLLSSFEHSLNVLTAH
jgi:hypothetical protein